MDFLKDLNPTIITIIMLLLDLPLVIIHLHLPTIILMAILHLIYSYPLQSPKILNLHNISTAGSFLIRAGNSNGSGTQTNGGVKVGNAKEKSGGVDVGKIGGNHDNHGGQQVTGNINAGNTGC